jgi:hypothetical protein
MVKQADCGGAAWGVRKKGEDSIKVDPEYTNHLCCAHGLLSNGAARASHGAGQNN